MPFRKTTSIIIIFFIASIPILSHPRFALRYNDKCSNCHFNPSGGGMRNEDGFTFGRNIISMFTSDGKEVFISPKLSDNISYGFDYRSQFLYSGEKKKGDFQDMTGSLYLNAALSNQIGLITRYDFVQSIWEWFAVAKILPNISYVKAGSFVPDFGIRLDDHTAYTRGGDYGLLFANGSIRGLLFNPFYTVTGIEVGVNINSITSLTVSVGKSKLNGVFSSDPTFTSRIEMTPNFGKLQLLAGASFSAAKTKYSDPVSGAQDLLPSNLYGLFAGVGFERFVLMGEMDFASDYLKRGTTSNSYMLEASYQVLVGLEAVLRYDKFIPDKELSFDSYSHLILGFEFFPYNFIEIRPQYRINVHDPLESTNSFLVQFHFYY